jgi:hypothetical protein
LENYNKWIAGARPKLKLNARLKNYSRRREENVGVLTNAQASTSTAVADEQIIHTVSAVYNKVKTKSMLQTPIHNSFLYYVGMVVAKQACGPPDGETYTLAFQV